MDSDDEPRTFAEKLDHLFRTVHPPGKGPYTYEQVAAGCADRGYEISVSYLWQLRNGQRDNPTLQHIQGLAEFFGVPASYFLDSAVEQRVNEQLDRLVTMREATIENVALRAHGLSDKGLAALDAMIDQLRNLENLPPEPPRHDPQDG